MSDNRVIPFGHLKHMLSNIDDMAILLRYGLLHFQRSADHGDHEHRLDGFKAHAIWLSEARTTLDVLDLLWKSSEYAMRVELVQILRKMINEINLPMLAKQEQSEQQALASTIIFFVREHQVVELVPNLRAKSFATSWWIKNRHLTDILLHTMYSFDDNIDAHEYLGMVIENDLFLKSFSYEKFSFFCLAYTAGIAASYENDRNCLARLKRRLDKLIKLSMIEIDRDNPSLELHFGDRMKSLETELGVSKITMESLPTAILDRVNILINNLVSRSSDFVSADTEQKFRALIKIVTRSTSGPTSIDAA